MYFNIKFESIQPFFWNQTTIPGGTHSSCGIRFSLKMQIGGSLVSSIILQFNLKQIHCIILKKLF